MIRGVYFIIFCLYQSLAGPLLAQRNAGSIKGRIIDANGRPAYVSVALKKLGKLTLTDDDGFFELLNLPALKDTLVVTSIESRTYIRPVNLEKNNSVNLGDIQLGFQVRQLQNPWRVPD